MLPATFLIDVQVPALQRAGAITPIQPRPMHWGLITAGNVQAEQARTLASAQATDVAVQACTSMSDTLKTAWADFLAGLTTWCNTPMVNVWTPWMPANAVVVTGDTGQTMMAWEAQLEGWQQALAASCASSTAAAAATAAAAGQPPPPEVTFPPELAQLAPTSPNSPPTTPSWLCTTIGMGCEETSWADTVKWLAILGVVGLGAWYAGPLIVTMVGAAAGAVRERAGGER